MSPPIQITPLQVFRVSKYPDEPFNQEWKFFVVMYRDGDMYFGFFINTDPPAFLRRQSDFEVCNPVLRSSENPFLKYDSFLGCSQLQHRSEDHLKSRLPLGRLPKSSLQLILDAVKASRTLKPFQKKRILESLGSD